MRKVTKVTFFDDALHRLSKPFDLVLYLTRLLSQNINECANMKAIAYSIKSYEKEHLVKSNAKLHELTLISNELNANTLSYCSGKTVVIISGFDLLDKTLLFSLKQIGIRHIITRSKATTHIDLIAAYRLGIKVANNPSDDQSIENTARQTIRNLSLWESGKCVGNACVCLKNCNDSNNTP